MKFSVVTPSYNQGQFIERTLLSVAGQSGVDVEHVVIDGGSTDGTVAVLKRYPAVRWTSGKDAGQADAVNKGIMDADGDVVAWINSDDIYYPGAFAKVRDMFAAHPDVDVVYGMADHIDINDQAFETYPTETWNLKRLRETCFICQPALFFRRKLAEEQGALDASLHFCMDYEYWLRLGLAGVKFAYLEDKLAGSRLYADNKTLAGRVKVHQEINDMQRRLFGDVPAKWIYAYAHAFVERRITRSDRPRLFLAALAVVTVIAAMRWNGTISPEMRTMLMTLAPWRLA